MPTVTLAQLESKVYSQLEGNTSEFPEPNLRLVINQGLRRLNLLVGLNQVRVLVPGFSVANQLLYNRPPGILVPLSLDFEGTMLEPSSLASIARKFLDFSTDYGTPARWCRIGLNRFMIHPADAYGGGFLEMTGIAPITPLAGADDVVSLEDAYAEILVNWAKYRIMLKETGKSFADASLGYQAMITQVKQYMIWSDMKFPPYWILKEADPGTGKGT